jgi:hypothetical protein
MEGNPYIRKFPLLIGILALFISSSSCESDSGDAAYKPDTTQTGDPDSGGTSSEESDADDLNPDDRDALYFMLEEEKLARDVYSYLGGLWGTPVFENIMQSEIQHVAAVETLLTAYGLEYEILAPGIFENDDLQTLYDELTASGTQNPEAALRVGATIEDLDIRDLQEFIDGTETTAIQSLFESLQCGSRNHLRAFIRNLENLGATYIPQFISQELYQTILNSSQEQCN